MNMSNKFITTDLYKLILNACFVLALSACSDNDDKETLSETIMETPDFIQKIAAGTVAGGEIKAFITIDSTRKQMQIDTNSGTSSASIAGLKKSLHTIIIEFEFTNASGSETVTLATASKTIDLASDTTLSFTLDDYEIDNFDDDNDGVSNLAEIRSETDPNDNTDVPTSACEFDTTSGLGSCALG